MDAQDRESARGEFRSSPAGYLSALLPPINYGPKEVTIASLGAVQIGTKGQTPYISAPRKRGFCHL